MSKIKRIIKTGALAVALSVSGVTFCSKAEEATDVDKESTTTTTNLDTLENRHNSSKIYHRFEEIPEVTDQEALTLFNRDDYTYIINAELYQKTGELELKRVLNSELTKANVCNIMYRSECVTHIPLEHEDQLKTADVDFLLLNPTGKYKGPTQMNDDAIKSFLKYLLINPETRPYAEPFFNYNPEDLAVLERNFFDENGNIRPISDREKALISKEYSSLNLKSNTWQTLASPKLKSYIRSKENTRNRHGAAPSISTTAKNYFCLTECFPDSLSFIKALEEYNLSTFQAQRKGKTKQTMTVLASSFNLKDENNEFDATRLPTFVISASISNINWKGNGIQALKDARTIRTKVTPDYETNIRLLKTLAKSWTAGKGKRYGVDELAKLNIITPEIIDQYRTLELAGAEELERKYRQKVAEAEHGLEIYRTLHQETLFTNRNNETTASTLPNRKDRSR